MSNKVTPIDKAMRKKHGLIVQPEPTRNQLASAHDTLIYALREWEKSKENSTVGNEYRTVSATWALMMLSMKTICELIGVDAEETIRARKNFGLEKYGTELQPYNGRNNLEDALDEVIDGLVYLMCQMYEDIYDENGVERDGTTEE